MRAYVLIFVEYERVGNKLGRRLHDLGKLLNLILEDRQHLSTRNVIF